VNNRSRAHLQALIEECTVDCYNDDEQLTGIFTKLEEHLEMPFQTVVLGATVAVERLDLRAAGDIVAICSGNETRQPISLRDLPLPTPLPDGAEWIEAYRQWAEVNGRV
jgi:hypothetical protein